MAYNYGAPPGALPPRPSTFGSQPGVGFPPGTALPPGMDASIQAPAGMNRPPFLPPPNMPNINFNAPVIRLGVDGATAIPQDRPLGRGSNAEPVGRHPRAGLGADPSQGRHLDRDRAVFRDAIAPLQPPTREEVARTIFVGGLGRGAPDDASVEKILRCAGKLRRWTRVRDADEQACKFGFAEYEDVDSLEAANEIFVDVDVPVFHGGKLVAGDDGEWKKMRLLVVVDEQSKSYIEEWKGRSHEPDDVRQFRIDGCRDALRQCLAQLMNAAAFTANATNGETAGAADDNAVSTAETNGDKTGDTAQVVTIPLTLEDELSDIPATMRATVAEEIRAFRDRSTRRDMERLRKEEEMEQAERQKSGARIDRLASPAPQGAPAGPASAVIGPRDRHAVQGAPSGPKGYRGVQLPGDYANGVSFHAAGAAVANREDEDAEESDEELERRRRAKKDALDEEAFQIAERRLLNRERTRGLAQKRMKERDEADAREHERQKASIAKRLAEWNDDEEARVGHEEYYRDRSAWLHKRTAARARELREDERDRAAEEREKADDLRAATQADDFLEQTAQELTDKGIDHGPLSAAGGFKLSLSSAAARSKAQAQTSRRAIADVENLLDDEDDAAAAAGLKRPTLRPLEDTSTAPLPGTASDQTPAERRAAQQAIALAIPTSTPDLFAYAVKFNYLTDAVLADQIRPFVEKKVLEFVGVQEELLVDAVVDAVRLKRDAQALATELEEAMEDEAVGLVRKVWRMLVFLTECEARGLNTD